MSTIAPMAIDDRLTTHRCRSATVVAVGLVAVMSACGTTSVRRPVITPAAPVPPGVATDPHTFPPPSHRDPGDVPSNPLDLRHVTFGQRETQLELSLRTAGNWSRSDLADDALCVDLWRRQLVGRVCVKYIGRKLALEYRRIAGTGRTSPPRAIPALISRPNRHSLVARLHARAVDLPDGRFGWSVTSRWSGEAACAIACVDRVPDRGAYAATVSPLAEAPCFGAAARAPTAACRGPRLHNRVTPTPSDAAWSPGSPCLPTDGPLRSAVLRPCEFGDRDNDRPPALALIGDSHAEHWRPAVDVAAQARGWRAVNLTRPGCSFSSEVYPAPAPIPADCHRHTEAAIQWLRAHPSVRTVITASSAGRGLSPAGYLAVWRRVPRSVKHIYVLRDVPRMRLRTAACVSARLRRHAPSARACSVRRRTALITDTSAQAAASSPARVRLIDLTGFFCDQSRCFPVVGGAYVYKDDNHMNATFARTLGPFLLNQMN